MINTLDDYIPHSMPQWEAFTTNPNLLKKVDWDGKLLPYGGNTAVFLLDEHVKQCLLPLRDSLYHAAADMLAEPLQMSTFHMTLHDLVNGKPDQTGLREAMAQSQTHASRILSRRTDRRPLRMKATWLFNMVNTSIVLGLTPADEESRQRLEELYTALEAVIPLGYALTPHITMAYFRPGTYTPEQVSRISTALRKVELDIVLSMEHLVLQNFTDMNHYFTIG